MANNGRTFLGRTRINELAFFSHKPTLAGIQVELRPFIAADIDRMGAILADPEVLTLTGSVHSTAEANGRSPVLSADIRSWYESRLSQCDRLDLAVIDRASGTCVGEVVLNELHEADNSCSFRTLLGPYGRNRGLGSEATRLLLDYAFTATSLNRIELEVYAFNPRARRVYERAGFVVEGVKREAFRFDGSYIDTIIMAVLRGKSQG